MSDATEDAPKTWAVKLPDGTMQRFTDLPCAVIEQIAADVPDVSQFTIAFAPLTDLRVARRAWRATLTHAGHAPTEDQFNAITVNELYEQFEQVDDDTPGVYEDGAPKAADAGSTAG